MKNRLFLCWLLAGAPLLSDAATYVSVNLNLSTYPDLVPVPGYPVYYAPHLRSNFFFYDGLYWLLIGDSWYVSSWYNGPWSYVGPDAVPLFLLRIPVRYYLDPPIYFGDWRRDAPPMWGRHWGPDWDRRHEGWERWNRRAVPAPAPLPTYQRQYAGSRYPQPAQQQVLQSQNYRYRPHDAVVQQHVQPRVTAQETRPAPPQPERQHAPPGRQEHQQQAQPVPPPAPHNAPPGRTAQPLPPAPPNRMETNRPPPQREAVPAGRQQAMPPGHAAPPHEATGQPARGEPRTAPPHEAAGRPERGEERKAPPGKQNEGRRDKDEHNER
jgi:hypothetical protein